MATKTDIELKIVDSVDTSHSDEEVLADSASNPDAFYVGRGYLAKGGEKVIENIDEKGTYPNVTVGNATKATTADTATRANTAATAATAVNISDAPVLTATEDEQITVKVGNKTSNPLTVPYAQRADFATDLSGRVEATPEVFTYRPSAGDKSIKDDNAFIRRVKGNSVVFNQFSLVEGEVSISGTDSTKYLTYPTTNTIPKGHKVYISAAIKITDGFDAYNVIVGLSYYNAFYGGELGVVNYQNLTTSYKYFSTIVESLNDRNSGIALRAQSATTGIVYFKDVIAIDLTQMFGAGNEPTTVEEFRALYPNSYYPYNAGELRNLVCSGIKTVGFNLVDKNYFLTGVIAGSSDTPSQTQKSDYRYIKVPVFPNTEYYLKDVSNLYYYYSYILYDSNMNRIKAGGLVVRDDYPYNASFVTTTPSNAAYMIINVHKDFVDTCCVNLHHTGYRDGEYEPYKEVNHALPLSKITNGEPLRKAGSVYDEINETEYIKRVGVVDLGSYDWYETPNGTFNTVVNIPDIKAVESESNYTCKKYIGVDNPSTIYAGTADNLTISTNAAGRIYIRDDAYKTGTAYAAVPALKASLSGVLLHYELAEPIITPIETPIDFNYYVEDFGTEEALLAEDSAPFSADIVYQFNAVDNIRQNRISIQKLNDIFSGSKGEYVRADGSWGYIADLKGNFFVKPTLKRIRTGISELSDTIQIIHPYLTEHIGDAKIVLMAVKRRGGSYYDRATNAKGRRKKRKAWGELHYAAMPNREMNHNTIEMPNGASFEAWQSVILNACGRIPEGLENAREPYNVNVAFEDLTDFFAANGAIFVGKTPVIRLGVALRIPNPNFIDYGNGNKMWDYNNVTGKWEYKYLYSDVAEVVVKSQMLRTGGYVLGLELV